MDELKEVKKRVYDDQRIEEILRELNCHSVKPEQRGGLITAGLPDGNNRRSIQIRNNEHLTVNIRSRGIKTDIYGLVGYILYDCQTFDEVRENLYQIKSWICNTLGYEDNPFETFEEKVDHTSWLKGIKRKRNIISYNDNQILDENVLNQYIMLPNLWWVNDGISTKTQRTFEVGYDLKSERITFAVRNKEGKLISVKTRYVGKDEQILDERKYIYFYPVNKSYELFNLHRAMSFIQNSKECIIVEGAKTVMILFEWGIKNVISIEGDSISPVQVKLLKELGLDVRLVFAWDKDKDTKFIKTQLKQIKNRTIYALYDTKNLLGEKMSPVDRGLEVWNQLYEKRYLIK